MKYRKKPVVIEAFQMTIERRLDNSEWPEWLNAAWQKSVAEVGALFCSADGCIEGELCTPLFIQTLEGTHRVDWDDWIIRGIKNELYPCKPDIFAALYNPVAEKVFTFDCDEPEPESEVDVDTQDDEGTP